MLTPELQSTDSPEGRAAFRSLTSETRRPLVPTQVHGKGPAQKVSEHGAGRESPRYVRKPLSQSRPEFARMPFHVLESGLDACLLLLFHFKEITFGHELVAVPEPERVLLYMQLTIHFHFRDNVLLYNEKSHF